MIRYGINIRLDAKAFSATLDVDPYAARSGTGAQRHVPCLDGLGSAERRLSRQLR
jgi:hypothetical protein